MPEYRQPLFGSDGEPCSSCGAPLASDQRYCLSCGARRGAARLPFRDILQQQARTTTELMPIGSGYAAVPPAQGDTVNDRLRRNAPLMALVGILLLAMLIGVLLGHWAGEDQPTAAANPRPQVIQVGAAAAPAAATTPVATAPAETTPTETTPTTEKKTSSSDSGAAAAPATKEVKDLEKATGKDAVKAAEKLPKTFSTGGKAPPKDKKPAAGGADFEEIG
ncbi:MAG TPA: hypothetical protein VFZ89_17850 [Solirubrobacteraceae bacterium]